MMEQDTQQQINILKEKVTELEDKSKQGAFLNRFRDVSSKKIVNQVVAEQIHDSLWSKLFYVSSFASASMSISSTAFTVTIASPAVFTDVAHGLKSGKAIKFTTTGALPTGLTVGTRYYVISAGLTSDEFQVSTSSGGGAVNTSGSQSGTHSWRTAELLDANGRESDTSAGNRFRPERASKFKTAFYLNSGISKSTVYITSPAVSLSSSIGTAILDTNKGFVGVKIVAGAVSLVTSNTGSTSETLISTTTTISDNTTHILEIDYYVSHAVVKFNNDIIGDISCNFNVNTFETFFPFLTSVGSSDVTSVNLTMESYEFIQRK